jgi:hypothetical protein
MGYLPFPALATLAIDQNKTIEGNRQDHRQGIPTVSRLWRLAPGQLWPGA